MNARRVAVRFFLVCAAMLSLVLSTQFARADTPASGAYNADTSINTECPSGVDPKTGYKVNYGCDYPSLNSEMVNGQIQYQQCEKNRKCTEKSPDGPISGICVAEAKCKGTTAPSTSGQEQQLNGQPYNPQNLPSSPSQLTTGTLNGTIPTNLSNQQMPPGWQQPAGMTPQQINNAFENPSSNQAFQTYGQNYGQNFYQGYNSSSFWQNEQQTLNAITETAFTAGESILTNAESSWGSPDTSGFGDAGSFNESAGLYTPPDVQPSAAGYPTPPNPEGIVNPSGAPESTFATPGAPNGLDNAGLAGNASINSFCAYTGSCSANELVGTYNLSNGGKLVSNSEGITYTAPDGSESFIPRQDVGSRTTQDVVTELTGGNASLTAAQPQQLNTGQTVSSAPQSFSFWDPNTWFSSSDVTNSTPPATVDGVPVPPIDNSMFTPAAGDKITADVNNANGQDLTAQVQAAAAQDPTVQADLAAKAANEKMPPLLFDAGAVQFAQENAGTINKITFPIANAAGNVADFFNPVRSAEAHTSDNGQGTLGLRTDTTALPAAPPAAPTPAAAAEPPAPAAAPPAAPPSTDVPAAVKNNNGQLAPEGISPQSAAPAPPRLDVTATTPTPVPVSPSAQPAPQRLPTPTLPVASWTPLPPSYIPAAIGGYQTSAPTNPMPVTQYGPIATCAPNLPCVNFPIQYAAVKQATSTTQQSNTSQGTNSFSATINALLKAIGIPVGSSNTLGSAVQPEAALVASPQTIAAGGTTQLLWTSTNTQSCSVYDGTGAQIASGGSDGSITSHMLTATTVFTVRCATTAGNLISSQSTVIVQ
jgi:hypothetical protein